MILGLSLNSRIVGMAVLDSQTLLDHGVRLFKERWSQEKLLRIVRCISLYCQDYSITSIALIQPPVHYRTPQMKELLNALKRHCRTLHLPLCCYKTEALHVFCGTERAKKKALMQELSLRHPELTHAQQKELQNKKKYYIKLFEAVGAATLHLQEGSLTV
jgi:hypothetical protein